MRTLQDILIDVNAKVDLSATVPSGSELLTRANYANQAVWEASAVGPLHEFTRVYEVDPASLASIPLPAGFREFTHNPQQLVGSRWVEYKEILPEERYDKDTSENYCYILGNPSQGFTAIFNNLTANATLSFTFQAFPSGLLTLTDRCELSDPTYVTAKTESYVLQSRRDARFPYVDAIANRKLKDMYTKNMKSPGGQARTTPHGNFNPLG